MDFKLGQEFKEIIVSGINVTFKKCTIIRITMDIQYTYPRITFKYLESSGKHFKDLSNKEFTIYELDIPNTKFL